MGKVIFEYDDIEERDSIKMHINAFDFYLALSKIDDALRSHRKGWVENPEEVLETITTLIPYDKMEGL